MSNQPPTSRPFIRLPYFGRQPAQRPPPRPAPVAQPPRPPIVRGGFAQALRPNPPQIQPPAPRQPPPPQLRSPTASPPLPSTPERSPISSPPPPPPQLRSATPSPPLPSTPKRSPISSPPPPPPQLRSATPSPPLPSTPKRSLISSPMPSPMASPKPSPTTKTINLPTPRESPKSAQRSAQSSPSPVMATRSPSPISLPPSQPRSSTGEVEHWTLAEADQKAVDKQVVYTTPKTSPVKGFANTYKVDNDQNKQSLLSDPKDDGLVTMAGENRGAVMEFDRDGKFPHNVSDDSEEESDEDTGRGRSRRLPRNAYVNSNVQGVSDSILYNCSISHHDPGVHFSLSRNGYSYSKGNGNGKGDGNGVWYHGNGKRL